MAIEHEVPEPTLGIYSGSGSSSLFWAKTFTVHFFCIDFRQFGHIFTFLARSRMMTNTSLNFVFLLPREPAAEFSRRDFKIPRNTALRTVHTFSGKFSTMDLKNIFNEFYPDNSVKKITCF